MRTLNSVFFIITFLTLFIFSCNENESPTQQYELTASSQCFGFTGSELESVGLLHNNFVITAYSTIDFSNCSNCKDTIVNKFMELDVDLSNAGITKADLIQQSLSIYEQIKSAAFDARNLNNHHFSAHAYSYLSQIMAEIDQATTYPEFISSMNLLQLSVNSNSSISCLDRELLNGTIEVAKNSSQLWTPVNLGGLGYYKGGNLVQAGDIEFRYSWKNAVKADVATSAIYWARIGVFAAVGLATPGSNVALLGGWAFTAALSSALGGIE